MCIVQVCIALWLFRWKCQNSIWLIMKKIHISILTWLYYHLNNKIHIHITIIWTWQKYIFAPFQWNLRHKMLICKTYQQRYLSSPKDEDLYFYTNLLSCNFCLSWRSKARLFNNFMKIIVIVLHFRHQSWQERLQ